MNWKAAIVTVITTIVLSSPLLVSHILWRAAPLHYLRLLVVNYTVPTDKYRNHLGLFWLLNHFKVTPTDEIVEWDVRRDYIGYRPGLIAGETRLQDVSLIPYDWVYVADTYGVWLGDLRRATGVEDDISNARPKLVFGGLSREDVDALSHFVADGKNIVLEFNAFGDPTGSDERKVVEKLVGVHTTGWSGCFLPDMEDKTAVPVWLPELYANKYLGLPLPRGPGLLFIHRDGRLLLLHGERFENTMPSLVLTEKGRNLIPRTVGTPPYIGWFSVVSRGMETETLAELRLPTPEHWKKRLMQYGIPAVFPLLTKYEKNGSIRYNLTANLSNMDEVPDHYQLAGLPTLEAAVHRRRDSFSYNPSYWQFFFPVMGELLVQASAAKPKGEVVK